MGVRRASGRCNRFQFVLKLYKTMPLTQLYVCCFGICYHCHHHHYHHHHQRCQSCRRQVDWSSQGDVSAVSHLSVDMFIVHRLYFTETISQAMSIKSSFESVNCINWHHLFWQAIPQVDHYSKEIRSHRSPALGFSHCRL